MQLHEWTWWEILAIILIAPNWLAILSWAMPNDMLGQINKRWGMMAFQAIFTLIAAAMIFGTGWFSTNHLHFAIFIFVMAGVWLIRYIGELKGLIGSQEFNGGKYWLAITGIFILLFVTPFSLAHFSEKSFVEKAIAEYNKDERNPGKAVLIEEVNYRIAIMASYSSIHLDGGEVLELNHDLISTETRPILPVLENMAGKWWGISRSSIFIIEHEGQNPKPKITRFYPLFP